MPTDYPLIRQSILCPLCGREKGNKNLTCWPCWIEREGAKTLLEHFEEVLTETEARYQLEARR